MKAASGTLATAVALLLGAGLAVPTTLQAAPSDQQLYEDFSRVEVASVADAMEQLYAQRNYMSHAMRPLAPAKFAAPAGSVYVMVLEDGLDFAGIGGLMATAMKARGLAGAVIDGSVRDLPQIQKLQFPVFSRGVVPSTTINHYRFAGANIPVTCAGVRVAADDIIVADLDGVAVVPRARAEEVLKKAQELDNTEHSMIPYIEKFRSIREAVDKFGRI